jgi:hypothetical protein
MFLISETSPHPLPQDALKAKLNQDAEILLTMKHSTSILSRMPLWLLGSFPFGY